jgi:hypothetical protein
LTNSGVPAAADKSQFLVRASGSQLCVLSGSLNFSFKKKKKKKTLLQLVGASM